MRDFVGLEIFCDWNCQLELPDARIILYGYNANASDFFSLKNKNSILCCTWDMLSDLNGICGGDMQVFPMIPL